MLRALLTAKAIKLSGHESINDEELRSGNRTGTGNLNPGGRQSEIGVAFEKEAGFVCRPGEVSISTEAAET